MWNFLGMIIVWYIGESLLCCKRHSMSLGMRHNVICHLLSNVSDKKLEKKNRWQNNHKYRWRKKLIIYLYSAYIASFNMDTWSEFNVSSLRSDEIGWDNLTFRNKTEKICWKNISQDVNVVMFIWVRLEGWFSMTERE